MAVRNKQFQMMYDKYKKDGFSDEEAYQRAGQDADVGASSAAGKVMRGRKKDSLLTKVKIAIMGSHYRTPQAEKMDMEREAREGSMKLRGKK